MAALFDSGRIVDGILVLILVEAIVLAVILRKGRRSTFYGIGLNLAAGAFLLLALRAVLMDAGWPVAAACLAGAGLAHAGDLVLRLRAPMREG